MKQLRKYQQQAITECWDALKKNDEPVLLMASVGAGKSLMLASILLSMQHAGKKALCIVNNAELCRNNAETFIIQGGNASIYCAALNSKDEKGSIVFGTPQSILNGINKNETIANIKFNLIVVDEAHTINYINHRSCFMRILRHYKHEYDGMRLLGATGTNFRFKGSSIVGDKCLFKTQVGNITTSELIRDGFLIKPHFEIDEQLVLDFSKVKIKQNGQFDQKQLDNVIEKGARLTELICRQVVHIMETQNRYGVFIFATTKKHAFEILSHLPHDKSAIILGETKQDERTIILDKARKGEIRYLVNIAIISVGVDVPAYDTISYLRPTESLVLLTQTMGRVLRLSDATGKKDALVLDFAGNIERHSHWDDPILLEALSQTIDKDKPQVIDCPACHQMNTEHARRCVGTKDEKRCDYYFEFKDCPNQECKAQNDISARHCRLCQTEIIDPNAKLKIDIIKKDATLEVDVIKANYEVVGSDNRFKLNCEYICRDKDGHIGSIKEYYMPSSDKAKNIFYGQFVRKHVLNSSRWYPFIQYRTHVEKMLQDVMTPDRLLLSVNEHGSLIKKKYFG